MYDILIVTNSKITFAIHKHSRGAQQPRYAVEDISFRQCLHDRIIELECKI